MQVLAPLAIGMAVFICHLVRIEGGMRGCYRCCICMGHRELPDKPMSKAPLSYVDNLLQAAVAIDGCSINRELPLLVPQHSLHSVTNAS